PVPRGKYADRAQRKLFLVRPDAGRRHAGEAGGIGDAEIPFAARDAQRYRRAAEAGIAEAESQAHLGVQRHLGRAVKRARDGDRDFRAARRRRDRDELFLSHEAARDFAGASSRPKNSSVRFHAAAADSARYLSPCGSMNAWPVFSYE